MLISEMIKMLESMKEEFGDLEVIKVNTSYDNYGYATYESDEVPGIVASTGEDFGIKLDKQTLVVY